MTPTTRICKTCGQPFLCTHGSKFYCSDSCRWKSYYKPRQGNGVEHICKTCGKVFYDHQARTFCCSKECLLAYRREQKEHWVPDTLNCVICGKKFTQKQPRQICCSKECTLKRQRTKSSEWASRGINLARHKKPKIEDTTKKENHIMPKLDEMTGDELLNYGKIQAERYMRYKHIHGGRNGECV